MTTKEIPREAEWKAEPNQETSEEWFVTYTMREEGTGPFPSFIAVRNGTRRNPLA